MRRGEIHLEELDLIAVFERTRSSHVREIIRESMSPKVKKRKRPAHDVVRPMRRNDGFVLAGQAPVAVMLDVGARSPCQFPVRFLPLGSDVAPAFRDGLDRINTSQAANPAVSILKAANLDTPCTIRAVKHNGCLGMACSTGSS